MLVMIIDAFRRYKQRKTSLCFEYVAKKVETSQINKKIKS